MRAKCNNGKWGNAIRINNNQNVHPTVTFNVRGNQKVNLTINGKRVKIAFSRTRVEGGKAINAGAPGIINAPVPKKRIQQQSRETHVINVRCARAVANVNNVRRQRVTPQRINGTPVTVRNGKRVFR